MTTPTVLHVTTAAKRPTTAAMIRRTEALVNKTRLARGMPPLPPEPRLPRERALPRERRPPEPSPPPEPKPKPIRRPKPKPEPKAAVVAGNVRREWKPPLRLDVSARWACRAMMGTYARRLGRPVTVAETLQEALRLMLVHAEKVAPRAA